MPTHGNCSSTDFLNRTSCRPAVVFLRGTEDFEYVREGLGIKFIHTGSTAVRNSIEKHAPLLGLHGHIHESKGFVRLGRTLCLNPGSEYADGILRGALVILGDGKVREFLLASG